MLPQALTVPPRRVLDRLLPGTAPAGSAVESKGLGAAIYERLQRLYELPQERQRAPAVEGLRGIAVALVFGVHYHALFSHYVARTSLTYHLSALAWNIGHSGVDIFFALSGALIYEVVLRRNAPYGEFLRRRAQRIYPAFLAVFAVYVALLFVDPASHLPAGPTRAGLFLAANVLLLPGIVPIEPLISVAWSLSYEFAFYILLPLLVYKLAFRQRSARSRILWMLVPAAVLITAALIHPMAHKRMLMFLAGMWAFEARNSTWFRSQLTRRAELGVVLLFVLSFPAMVACSATPSGPDIWSWSALGVLIVTDFWVVLYVTGFEGWLKSVCSLAGLRWLGNISYSFYLLHGLTLKVIATVLGVVLPSTHYGALVYWGVLPLAFPAAFVASTVLYATVEKPLSLRRRSPAAVPGAVV
jgi:exopolysaccharide production protein ExoZ